MAVVNPPFAMQGSAGNPNVQHDALLFRRALGATMSEGVGILNGGNDLKVTAGVFPNLNVDRGGAYIQGDDITNQGMYFGYNDASVSVAVAGAGNRNDLVVAEILDEFYGGASNTWRLRVISGTPGLPATPANCIPLANVATTAGGAFGTIVDLRTGAGHVPIGLGVQSYHLADDAVTTAKIDDAAVTSQKWSPQIQQAFGSLLNYNLQEHVTNYFDVPGCTLTVNHSYSYGAIVIGTFSFRGMSTSTNDGAGRMVCDGVAFGPLAIADADDVSGFDVVQTIVGIHSSGLTGSHVFKLQAHKGGSGGGVLSNDCTNILVIPYAL